MALEICGLLLALSYAAGASNTHSIESWLAGASIEDAHSTSSPSSWLYPSYWPLAAVYFGVDAVSFAARFLERWTNYDLDGIDVIGPAPPPPPLTRGGPAQVKRHSQSVVNKLQSFILSVPTLAPPAIGDLCGCPRWSPPPDTPFATFASVRPSMVNAREGKKPGTTC